MGEIFKSQEEKEHWLKQVQRIKKWCVDCEYEEEGPLGDPCHECLGCDIPSNADSYIPLCYKERK